MSTATASYEKSPLTLSPEEVQELPYLKSEDEPKLILDDNDDFEIPAEPPDDGGWFDVWISCPGSFEIPPRSRHCTPPLEL